MEVIPLANYKAEKPIVIFDSGVGGLSIYKSFSDQLKAWPVVYFSDNAGFPYGSKTSTELKNRINLSLTALTKYIDPALVIIACNTASTAALPQARALLSCPVVGVVPAIKPAVDFTKTGVIGLLATPATIRREYTTQLIENFAHCCDVIRVGSSALVAEAEEMLRGGCVDRNVIKNQLAPFFLSGTSQCNFLDCIILGCTHFPLLSEWLQDATLELANRPIQLIDSSRGVVNQTEKLLNQFYPLGCVQNTTINAEKNVAVFTQESVHIKLLAHALEELGFFHLALV